MPRRLRKAHTGSFGGQGGGGGGLDWGAVLVDPDHVIESISLGIYNVTIGKA